MIVARQFIACDVSKEATRPVGTDYLIGKKVEITTE
jgi:hypothetical protein